MAGEANRTPEEDVAQSTPISVGAQHTRQLIDHLEKSLKEMKSDVKEIRSTTHRHLLILGGAIASSFILLGGMMIAAYLRLDDGTDKVRDTMQTENNQTRETLHSVDDSVIRLEGKMDRVLDRLPPLNNNEPQRR